MDIILGATGHVGSVVAKNLLEMGEDITVVTHDPEKKTLWNKRGASVAVVDVHDTLKLTQVLSKGDKLFFLNPPADPALDTVKEEKSTVYSILEALKNSGIQKVVAESTYGSQPGDGLGDLGVLNEMEEGLKELGIRTSIIRAAYYMSNWDSSLQSAREKGEIVSLYPEDFKLPMVAPEDLGEFATKLLNQPLNSTGLYYVEGPERYSPKDVAIAFGRAMNKQIKVRVIEEGSWLPELMSIGFSQAAAESMVKMTSITLKSEFNLPESPVRGPTTLDNYIAALVRGSIH